MKVSGNLKIDGSLLANGLGSKQQNSGGASGGTISIITSSFSGLGKVVADGGDGLGSGNGGGGGCVAVHVDNEAKFKGTMQSRGGNGKIVGGAGTIYVEDLKTMIPR